VRFSSVISLTAVTLIIFTLGFVPYVSQDVFASEPAFSSFVADDPDDLDAVLSNGDTLIITFSEATNATNSGTMTQTELTANFTDTNIGGDAAVDWGTTFTGVWNAASTVLTVTLTDVTGATLSLGTSAIEGRSTTNISSAAEGTNTELLDATSVPSTLSGDFGLFVAVTASSNGSGCSGDCTEPTLGLNNDGRRIVDDGFTYNGKSIDVERYFTPYPLITVDVGKQNVAEFKIYDNSGSDNISHFELAFGLAKGEYIGMSKAVINWDKSWNGIETISIDDPENVLGEVTVTTSEGNCSDESQTKCLIVKIEHTFRAPLDFNILGTNVWDAKRNAWQNYYNHGIEVVGESLNPPKEYDGINRGQIYHLTETSKTSAVDDNGNSWSFEYGIWAMDYIPNEKPLDKTTMHGYTRTNSNFDMYKYGQYLIAENKLNEICPNCNDESYDKINDIFAYEYPISQSSLDNPMIQSKMIFESERAQKIMGDLLDTISRFN